MELSRFSPKRKSKLIVHLFNDQLFVDILFIPDDDICLARIVRFQHKAVRELVKVNILRPVPYAEERDQVFFSDFFLHPLPNGILVREYRIQRVVIIELAPLYFFRIPLGLFQVQLMSYVFLVLLFDFFDPLLSRQLNIGLDLFQAFF